MAQSGTVQCVQAYGGAPSSCQLEKDTPRSTCCSTGSPNSVRRLESGATGGSRIFSVFHGVTEQDVSTACSSEILSASRHHSSIGKQNQMLAAQNATDDNAHPCSAIKMCAHKEKILMAEERLRTMEAKSHLSVEAYNALIHTCSQAGEMERAEWHFKCMREHGLEPTLVTFNSVINACAMIGDIACTEKWFLEMLRAGIKPNEVTYGTICKVLAHQGEAQKVESIMQAMENNGTPLNEYLYGSLISACGLADPPDPALAERAFTQMVLHGFRPQSVKRALARVVGNSRATQLYGDLRKH